MSYLFDSDRVVDYLKGQADAIALLTDLTADYSAISVITYGEVYEGIYYGRDPQQTERGFERFLDDVVVLPLGRDVARIFARVRGGLRRSGQLISDTDLFIAATALQYDLTLVTRNVRHFERIPDLKLLSAPLEQADS
ncbi:type II toxin-antitoxin system VapC family toxin [soil metagenome]